MAWILVDQEPGHIKNWKQDGWAYFRHIFT